MPISHIGLNTPAVAQLLPDFLSLVSPAAVVPTSDPLSPSSCSGCTITLIIEELQYVNLQRRERHICCHSRRRKLLTCEPLKQFRVFFIKYLRERRQKPITLCRQRSFCPLADHYVKLKKSPLFRSIQQTLDRLVNRWGRKGFVRKRA